LAWGLQLYGLAVRQREWLDSQERLAHSFLLKVEQLLKLKQPLSAILQETLASDAATGLSAQIAPEQALAAYARHWPFRTLAMVADGALLTQAHGGSLDLMMQQALKMMHRERMGRQQRQLDEKVQTSTAVLLAVVPVALVGILRWMEPPMYNALASSGWGHVVAIGVGAANGLILAGIAGYLWWGDRLR
ncbi:MAG: hypothetical protein OWS74_04315, partial [Firmicutes bacterium]|nr:hypothetical protein [Bacillota bacterium]